MVFVMVLLMLMERGTVSEIGLKLSETPDKHILNH